MKKILLTLLLIISFCGALFSQTTKIYINNIPVYQTTNATDFTYTLFQNTPNAISFNVQSQNLYTGYIEVMDKVEEVVGTCLTYPKGICVKTIAPGHLEINNVPVWFQVDSDNNQTEYTLFEQNTNLDKVVIPLSVPFKDALVLIMAQVSDYAGSCDGFPSGICAVPVQ